MKRFFFILGCILISSCVSENKTQEPTWLFGNWERTNDTENKKTYEFWSTDFSGLGFTLKENDTVFKEHMSIITKKDTLYLQVSGVHETPILFKFTSQTDSSFVCENPTNEFPKKITYYKDNNLLKAEVSAGDFKLDFVFKKME